MTKRHHFSRAIIASVDMYKVHSHIAYLKENHIKNSDYLTHINATVEVKVINHYYVKCNGKLMKITTEEAHKISKELLIIK